ncbi:MAG: type II secretion system protein GspG [Planctomycetes bacterium]|nr:type II secretion system protein GspG [Planctomycetota bacterium]
MEPAPDKPYHPGEYVPPDLQITLRPIAVNPVRATGRRQFVRGLLSLLAGLIGLFVLMLALLYVFLPRYTTPSHWESAKVTMAEIGKALEMYKAETGAYPASLDELHSNRYFVNGVPKDPFSKDDFLYERTPDGFTLTCLGKDMETGGTEPPNQDIVFNEKGEVG